ncbi:ribonuclease H-like domain-containing protein [Tanacetum coccineum]
MDQDSAHMMAASKVPMLKPGEYEIWRMMIEQYIQMIDYALWEVIENGATLQKTKTMEGVLIEMPITTAKEKARKRLEDAKKLLEAVEKRFCGNEATKKTQRNLLKQQYENFTAPSSEMLDQTFDRLQNLVSQLELLGEKISQEDVNQKLWFRWISFDYRVTLGFGSIAGGLDHVNPIIRLPIEHGISRGTRVGTLSERVNNLYRGFGIAGIIRHTKDIYSGMSNAGQQETTVDEYLTKVGDDIRPGIRLSINIPFIEALEQMPKYAKFMKDILTQRGRGKSGINKALADLGASISLIPHSMFLILNLGELKPTRMCIELANKSTQIPRWIAENVIVKIDRTTNNLPIHALRPNWDLDFELMCDASDYAVGDILGQQVDKKFCPIYYASKTMNDAQEHYTTTEEELLAVCTFLDKFRPRNLGLIRWFSPGNFTLPCTIGKFNFYGMADLDMTKKAPLGKPFLATIHGEIDVFDKKISLGIDNARVSYDMEKKDHNFTTPTEKIFMIKSDLENRPQSSTCSNNQLRNLPDRSPDDSLHNQGKIDQLADEYEPGIGKKDICLIRYGNIVKRSIEIAHIGGITMDLKKRNVMKWE